MGAFFAFMLKSSLCLAMFYLFYRLLLSKETFHRFNRMALLGMLVLSCLLPMLVVTVQESLFIGQDWGMMEDMMQEVDTKREGVFIETSASFPWNALVLLVYAAGILFFVMRLLWSLARMYGLLRTCRMEQMADGITLFVHRKKISPFSWMKVIVVSEEDLEENRGPVLMHECAHIKNHHSWDLLLVEVCIFFQWFNPAAWLLKQELQAIHEFEADKWVIKHGIDAKHYQLLLIKKAVGERLFYMANSLNHGSLKKRIGMMIRKKSNPWARMKYLYVFPLSVVAVVTFARPEVANGFDVVSDARMSQLALAVGIDEKDMLEYSFRSKEGKEGSVARVQKGMFLNKLADSILFVVDGELKGYGQQVLNQLPVDRINSISVLRQESAVAEYGEKAKHGVIVVETKKGKPLPRDDDEAKAVMDEFKQAGVFRVSKLAPSLWTGGTPLIIVDGEVKGKHPHILEGMIPETIESVTVFKNQPDSLKKYGDMAKDGVIIITTKK